MKRIVSLVLVLIMSFSIVACDGGEKKAFEISKEAYANIINAYEITKQIGDDIYTTWAICVSDHYDVIMYGCEYIAKKTSLSEEEIKTGIAFLFYGHNWDSMSEEEKRNKIDNANLCLYAFYDNDNYNGTDMRSACVMSIVNAYVKNGKIEEAKAALDAAETQIKVLSEKYSDYEHYPNLKELFITTSDYLDYCENLEGSLAQVAEYNKKTKDYISKLEFFLKINKR